MLRWILWTALALALVGPSPFRGACELAALAKERTEEWTVFYQRARETAQTVSDRLNGGSRAGRRDLASR